jgi:hypothetical protein
MNFYEFYSLLNEYGQALIQTLIEKFQKEDPSLTRDTIEMYIKDFEKIKNKLQNKDISTYSWENLESTVDGNRQEPKIKAGKLDPTITDSNLLYNKDGVRIYLGKDKSSCIRYSNGYTFCIGARGERNMYNRYRIGYNGTPYFIFNDNLPKENNTHLMVLFVYENVDDPRYSVTLASNKPEDQKRYDKIKDIISFYPWVKPIENFVDDENKGTVKPDNKEIIEYNLKVEYNKRRSEKKFSFTSLKGKKNEESRVVLDHTLKHNLKDTLELSKGEKKIYNFNIIGISIVEDLKPFVINNRPSFVIDKDHNGLIKEIIKDLDWLESVGAEIGNKEETKNRILAKQEKIKQILENSNSFAPNESEVNAIIKSVALKKATTPQEELLHRIYPEKKYDWKKIFNIREIKDSILIRYPNEIMLICLGNPTEKIIKELKNNEIVTELINLDNNYIKQLNWIKSASEESLKKIIDQSSITPDQWAYSVEKVMSQST